MTPEQLEIIGRARVLADHFDIDQTRKSTGTTDTIVALAETLAEARHLLRELLAIIDQAQR